MYLSSFSLVEPEETLNLYRPSWLNVWESHAYNNGLKSTGANGWGFKRFGTVDGTYIGELIRQPNYIDYMDAMERSADIALYQLSAKERMLLLRSRTAFIYVDAWGESSLFEKNITPLHSSIIDTLPKNLVKKFLIDEVTCKIRGEKNGLIQALRLAQDYLDWDIFDFVIICGAYRAVPVLAFSVENSNSGHAGKRRENVPEINFTIERVGCFIFSQRENKLKVSCGPYVITGIGEQGIKEDVNGADMNFTACAGNIDHLPKKPIIRGKKIDLVRTFGSSGCLTPALSWQYISNHALKNGCLRTILPDNSRAYNYFDTWY